MVTGVFLVFVISLAGFRIIALQGNETEVEKQRKSFFNGLLGLVILLLARIAVMTIVGSVGAGPGGPTPIIVEVAGMAKFLLEILAGLAIIALMASGVFYIISLHSDERKQRGRRIIISCVIILIVVIAAHTLVATFIP
jgi:hypothetical protein